jgi:hypothetical protein
MIIAYCFGLFIAACIGISYWATSIFIRPNEPISIRIMYRYQDTDYLPFIFALARAKLHEFVTEEGGGFLPFPLLMDVPHAMMIALFGAWGFAVADALIMCIWFALFYLIARVFIEDERVAVLIALVMLITAGPWGWQRLTEINLEGVWNFRYTRPFIAGLFMLALVLTTRTIAASLLETRTRPGVYIVHGLLLGGSAQGDMHLAIIGCFVTAALYIFFLTRLRSVLWAKATCLTAAGFLLGVLPMLVQQAAGGNADYRARLGMFPIDRLSPPFYFSIVDAIDVAGVLGLWAAIYLLGRRYTQSRLRNINLLLAVIVGYIIFSTLSLPLFTSIMGRGFLLYEFHDRTEKFISLGFVVCLGLFLVLGFHAWWDTRKASELRVSVIVLVNGLLVVSIVGIGIVGIGLSIRNARPVTSQPRVWDWWLGPGSGYPQGYGWPVFPNYRTDFTRLAHELSRPQYNQYRILGTFDQQLGIWWLAFHQGFLFIPDAFASSLSDKFIESRTLQFLRLTGGTSQFLDRKLDEEYFIDRFFSHDEWQASAAYTYRNIDDYSPSEIEQIRKTTVLDSWSTMVPQTKRQELLAAFNAAPAPTQLPELIILPKGAGYEQLSGPAAPYRLTYENTTFRVWILPVRRG